MRGLLARAGALAGNRPYNALAHEDAETLLRDRPTRQALATHRERLSAFLAARGPAPANPRVVFLVNFWHRAGGVLSVAMLVNDLRALGVDARVVVRSPEGFADDIPLDPPPVIFSSRRAFFRDFPPADLVVATYWATVPWVVRLLAARAGSATRAGTATRAGFTPAYFVQDYEPAFYPPGTPLHAAARDTYALTPYAFAKTPWVRDRVAEAGGRISLVPPALDLDRFHPPDTPPEAPVVLAMLRPGTPRRGFETTVRVLRAIRAACPEARLEVFGCSDVDLAKRGVDLPLTNHGPTPNDALAPLYRSATVFLECSTFQAFGRTIAEALASGTPCVVTESGGPSLFVRHEENALVAAPGDADTLASHAVRLLTDRRLRARLAGNARPSVAGFERRRAAERARDCLHWFLTPGSDQGPPADFI